MTDPFSPEELAKVPDQVRSRFMGKVEKGEGCWIWIGYLTADGYGRFRLSKGAHMKSASRASWILHYGEVPEGQEVCHTCDNPSCVRPDHLFLGTHGDNMKDMHRKGRHPSIRGSRNPKAKLTKEQASSIRESPLDARVLAHVYGVHRSTIYKVRGNLTWGAS